MTSRIRRWVETDTGHRVPNHKSKCKNMHGHRYRWEVELEGEVVSQAGSSDEGMLMDFSDISLILEKYIHDVVDDTEAMDALSSIKGQKTLQVPFVPTAENLAKWAFEQVNPHIKSAYGNKIRLLAFHVRETPKSWASWYPRR